MSLPDLNGATHFLDLVSTTALRLYQADSLTDILQNTVDDVQQLLGTDRVVIYQLGASGQAQPAAVQAKAALPPLPDHSLDFSQCLQRWLAEATLQQPRAIDNLTEADLTPCEQTMLSALGIQASVLVPIYLSLDWQKASPWQDETTTSLEVWGFLVAQQSHPRHWSPLELSFLRQLTQHLFHAIQQMQLRQFSDRLIESAVDGIIALDTNFRYQVWNGPMEKMSGLSHREVIGQVAWEVFPCLKAKGEDKLMAMAMAGHSVVAQNRAFTVPERGRKGVFEARYSPLTDPSGNVLGCLGLVRDITEQKQMELQLRKTTSRLTTLIQNLESGILVEDENRRILLANQTFCDIFRLPLSPEALRGPDCDSLLRQAAALFQDPQTVIEDIQQILQIRQPLIGQEIQLIDGRTLERDYIPIFIDNDYQGHLWQYRDITERKRVQQQLEQAIRSTEAANRAKSNFLATMSHEIRTPLNAILGLTDLLRLTRLDDEQQDFVDTIHNSGSMLLALINDILDFSKIEADKLELERRGFGLHRCVQDVVHMMSSLADEKGLELQLNIAPDVPRRIIGDVTRLRQVLVNLVSNGVKFTQKGRVTIDVAVQKDPTALENTAEIRFAVQDTGVGIPEENCDGLFKAFSQLDTSVNRRFGGTGLGLAICKKLVEAMGGTIGFQTQPGVGTTFHFTIQAPLMLSRQHPDGTKPVEVETSALVNGHDDSNQILGTSLPLNILVVDDLAVNQKVAVKMLQRLGYKPDCISDGLTAFDRVQQVPYDLVLMDVQMPGMDGYEATELIRHLPAVTPERPWIVAMTAHSNQQDRQRSLQAGMNDFLSKPILLQSLTDCLVRYGRIYHPDAMAQFSRPTSDQPDPSALNPDQPLLDREMINSIRAMAGEEADSLLAELIANYQEDAARCLQQLHQAIQHQEGSQIRHQAHALRSMSLNLGALSLGNLCQELELHYGPMSPNDQKTALAEIEHLYAEVMVALQSEIATLSLP